MKSLTMTRSTAGESATLADLLETHRERLRQVIRFRLDKRLARRIDVDDVLQEASAVATRRFPEFLACEVSGLVWLRTIVHQTVIDLHRRHLYADRRDVRKERGLFAGPATDSGYMAAQLAGKDTTPSRAAIRSELAQRLKKAIDGLGPLDREVLALRHFEELTNAETAEALGISGKAASIRYVRALSRLRAVFQPLPTTGVSS